MMRECNNNLNESGFIAGNNVCADPNGECFKKPSKNICNNSYRHSINSQRRIISGIKIIFLSILTVFILFSSSLNSFCKGYDFAPSIKELPEVVIGDSEQGNSNNFFVFSDAFNFDTYVTDQDNTISELKWCFVQTQGSDTISINGLGAETSGDFLNPVNDIRLVSSTASFRNETLSPSSGHTPYPDPTFLDDAKLAIYVSDGTTAVSREIIVYSFDDAPDSLWYQEPCAHWEEIFSAQGGWNAYSGSTNITAPSSITSFDGANGRLALKFPVYPLPSPGFFQWLETAIPPATGVNPVIQYAPNTVYVLRASLLSDANDTVPAFRLRAQSMDNVWTQCQAYGIQQQEGEGAQAGVPQISPADFYMPFQPIGTTAEAFIAIDMFTALPYTGEVYINELEIFNSEIGYETSFSVIQSITSFADWIVFGNGAATASNITLNDQGMNYFGFAGKFVTLPTPIQPDTYYRLAYQISKTSSANPAQQVRLRVTDTRNGAYCSYFVYNDNNPIANLHLSSTTPETLYLWHYTKNGRSDVYGADLSVFFDYIDLSTYSSPDPGVILNRIEIEKATMQEFRKCM